MFGLLFFFMGFGLFGVLVYVNLVFFGRGNVNGLGMGLGMEGFFGGWGEVGMLGWDEY